MQDNIINLKCPSCGSPMGTPDSQGVSECPACHTKVIIPQSDTSKEKKNLARLKELCGIAINAPNYSDLLNIANEILEIDPDNVDGWIDKAMALSFLRPQTTIIPRRHWDTFSEQEHYLPTIRALSRWKSSC